MYFFRIIIGEYAYTIGHFLNASNRCLAKRISLREGQLELHLFRSLNEIGHFVGSFIFLKKLKSGVLWAIAFHRTEKSNN